MRIYVLPLVRALNARQDLSGLTAVQIRTGLLRGLQSESEGPRREGGEEKGCSSVLLSVRKGWCHLGEFPDARDSSLPS
jgi:hypothetical protein